MLTATVKLFKDGNLVAESSVNTVHPEGQPLELTDAVIDKWADTFRTSSLTLKSLNVDSWDRIEFDAGGIIHTRDY